MKIKTIKLTSSISAAGITATTGATIHSTSSVNRESGVKSVEFFSDSGVQGVMVEYKQKTTSPSKFRFIPLSMISFIEMEPGNEPGASKGVKRTSKGNGKGTSV